MVSITGIATAPAIRLHRISARPHFHGEQPSRGHALVLHALSACLLFPFSSFPMHAAALRKTEELN